MLPETKDLLKEPTGNYHPMIQKILQNQWHGLSQEKPTASRSFKKGFRPYYQLLAHRLTYVLRMGLGQMGQLVPGVSRQEMCPTRCYISYILDFLVEFFAEGYQYNTIRLHRSALSAFNDPIQGIKKGDHPRDFNQKPPQPKYTFMWDVEVVLEYLKNLPENNLLLHKTLIFKLLI